MLHFNLKACFIPLLEGGEGGLALSSVFFFFLCFGSFVSLATIEKSETQDIFQPGLFYLTLRQHILTYNLYCIVCVHIIAVPIGLNPF